MMSSSMFIEIESRTIFHRELFVPDNDNSYNHSNNVYIDSGL